jgi:protocatechuate 3,4-dioxygenase beta subunit
MGRAAALAVLLAALSDSLAVSAQQGRPPATIGGRITAAHNGEPIGNATVEAMVAGAGDQQAVLRRVTTDAQGRYAFPALPAGQYRLTASRTGFVRLQFGQRSAFESVAALTVRDGEQLRADFALPRGGAIGGRVFDQTGEPIANVNVQAMRVAVVQGRRQLVMVGARQTDDLGTYRLFGLAPGEYFIVATADRETHMVTDVGATAVLANGGFVESDGTRVYAPTYYPGTPRAADAYRINVEPGEDENNVNFSLTMAPLVRVSGRVVDASGVPIEARIELQPETGSLLASAHTRVSAPDGTFEISGVPAGRYFASVLGRLSEDGAPDVAWFPLEVDTTHISGLTIQTTRGATMSGSVLADGDGRVNTSALRIVAERVGRTTGVSTVSAQVVADSFEMGNLIGPYTLAVDQLPEGWAVASITSNGRDITDDPLEFRGGEQLNLQVVITNRLSELYGTVRAEGRVVPRAAVVVFPEDASKWSAPSRSIRVARTDQNGGFAVRSLLPNQRYLAVAMEFVEDGEHQNPEFLERVRPRAAILPASNDRNRTLDLTMVRR